jgi:hypothetical protein
MRFAKLIFSFQLLLLAVYASEFHVQHLPPNRLMHSHLAEKFKNNKPHRIVHIRNGTITGQTKKGIYKPIKNGFRSAHMDKINDLEKRFHYKNGDLEVDISILEEAAVVGLLGSIVCAFIPGCRALVASAWAAAGGLQGLVRIIRTGSAGSKRSTPTLYEEYGCVGEGGNICTSPIADAIIAAADVENGSAPQASYSMVTNPDDKNSLVGYTYYCAGNEPCSVGEVGPQPVDSAPEQTISYP